MLLPVRGIDICVRDRGPTVDHHSVTHIQPHMGGPGGVISPLEKDQVAGPGVLAGNRGGDVQKPVGGQPPHIPAGMIDDP